MGLILGGGSARDLILDGKSVSLYVGGNPPTKVWPTRETVQITLGTGAQARDQFRAAMSARGMDYRTATEIPFDIEFVGTGSVYEMFRDCAALTTAPAMDTSQVTDMYGMFFGCSSLTSAPVMDTSSVTNMRNMFRDCSSLTYVPDMDTSSVTDMLYMFLSCAALTDGNVRLIGKHPSVETHLMIYGSGLTREPWYTADDTPLEAVQITGTSGTTSRNQLRDAVAARGLDYRTVTHLPFEIDTSQATSLLDLFNGWTALVAAPEMTTLQVTDMGGLFRGCTALEYVGDLQTSKVTNAGYMFNACPALTDGNVRLLGKHPNVSTTAMITNSGLTREPWYNADGTPLAEVYEVSMSGLSGNNTAHPLVTVTVPAGETWSVRIQGTVTEATTLTSGLPFFRIGVTDSGPHWKGAVVDFSGTVTAANSTIAIVTKAPNASFVGTVTIKK